MTDSPPENPYASPATVNDNLEPQLAGEARELPPIRPRWWEIGLFAVLMSGALGMMGFITYLALTDQEPLTVRRGIILWVATISLVTTTVGGIVALRVSVENGLHRVLPPGHSIMIAVLLGAIITIAGMIFEASSYSLGPSLKYFLTQFIQESRMIAIYATMFVLMWRQAIWRWLGAMALAVGTLEFCLWLFAANTDFWMPRKSISGGPAIVLAILWLFAAVPTGIVALREYYLGPRRDWLHWTGVICWILPIILTSVHKLVEELV